MTSASSWRFSKEPRQDCRLAAYLSLFWIANPTTTARPSITKAITLLVLSESWGNFNSTTPKCVQPA